MLIAAAIVVAAIILVHHIVVHPEYSFPDRAFQVSDILNHETYIIACLAFAAGAALE